MHGEKCAEKRTEECRSRLYDVFLALYNLCPRSLRFHASALAKKREAMKTTSNISVFSFLLDFHMTS